MYGTARIHCDDMELGNRDGKNWKLRLATKMFVCMTI